MSWSASAETHPTEMEKKEEFNLALAANGVTVVDPLKDLSRLSDTLDPAVVVRIGHQPPPNTEAERRLYSATPAVDFHSALCPVTGKISVGYLATARFQRHFMPGELKVSADTLVKNLVLNALKGAPAGYETLFWGFGYEYGIELAVLHGHKSKEDSHGG